MTIPSYSSYMDLTNFHNMLPTLNSHIPRPLLLNPAPERPLAVNPGAIHPVPGPKPEDVPDTAKYTRLTYLPFLLKTLSFAMIEWPLFRSSITPPIPIVNPNPSDNQGHEQKHQHPSAKKTHSQKEQEQEQEKEPRPTLTVSPQCDISIALSTPTGLYTPTLRDLSSHSLYSLASALSHLSALGRQTPCGLGPAEMPRTGGSLTLSNIGSIGRGEFAHPVLLPGGGVAIAAVGRARWVWDEERKERRMVVGVSWSADHRVVEGAEMAAFVECWRGYVEYPERLVGLGV